MQKKNSNYAWGFILILLGGLMLARELFPQINMIFDWPWLVVGVGLVFLLFAFFTRTGGLAIPGTIVSGIGAILYYQNLTGNWGTWSFAWTLIPGFVGIGIGLATLISPNEDQGGWTASFFMIALSAIMFIIFGGSKFFGLDLQYLWPIIIIVFGIFILIKGFSRK